MDYPSNEDFNNFYRMNKENFIELHRGTFVIIEYVHGQFKPHFKVTATEAYSYYSRNNNPCMITQIPGRKS